MRKLIFAINTTLDGCCEHTKMIPDEELLEHYTQLVRGVDLFVYGRKTYELMIPYWPEIAKNQSESKAENEYALVFDAASKVVFSRTLTSSDDKKTRIVNTDLREEILKLKQEPGRDILAGGISVPAQLVQLGLVDEYRIMVCPIIAGEGRRLFDNVSLPERLRLKLVDSKILKSGCVALRYVKQ